MPTKNKLWLLSPVAQQRRSDSPSPQRFDANQRSGSAQIGRHRLAANSPSPGVSSPKEEIDSSQQLLQKSLDRRISAAASSIANSQGDGGSISPQQSRETEISSSAEENQAESRSRSEDLLERVREEALSRLGKSAERNTVSSSSELQAKSPLLHGDLSAATEPDERQWRYKIPAVATDAMQEKEALANESSQASPLWMVPKIIHRPSKPVSTLGVSSLSLMV